MSQPAALVFGTVELRLAERVVLVDGQEVGLGSRGFDLLKALVTKRDRVVSKDELLDEVWPGLVVEENNLQVQISGLRRVLGARAISTVAGLGYRFTLAAGPASQPVSMPAPMSPSTVQTGARVLVADDNKVNRLLLCRSLELMGHEVSSAENGLQALELLKRKPFELLLLDLAMPEMDGYSLLQARAGDAALREVAVIVTSALGGVAPVARCIELGADDFLHKPVDPWLLRARVESSLLRKQQRDHQSAALRRWMPGGPAQAVQLSDVCALVARLHEPAAMAESPQALMELLGHWSTLMFDAVEGRGGEVVQFTGDTLLALFAEPGAAVQAARDMCEVAALLNTERGGASQAGRQDLVMGVGVSRGAVMVGSAATARRAAYACVGLPVQHAVRLAELSTLGAHGPLLDDRARAGLHADHLVAAVTGLPAEEAWRLL